MSRVHDALRRADVPKPPDDPEQAVPVVSAEAATEAPEVPVDGQPVAAIADEVEAAPPPPVEVNVTPAETYQPVSPRVTPPPPASPPVEDVVEAPFLPPAPPVAPPPPPPPPTPTMRPAAARAVSVAPPPPVATPSPEPETDLGRRTTTVPGLFGRVEVIPFNPPVDASLLDPARPQDGPIEEFRGIRTRLNHLQNQKPIRTVVVTSPSPAEGKSFTASNLALIQAQLEGAYVLLADFDFRRPSSHHLFQVERSPGLTDYLQGKVLLEQALKRVEGTNLFILPAGEAVNNPLELLNLPEAKRLLDYLASLFRWVIIDTPPLLFAADANLLSTMCDGTVMVVRIGSTTIDSVTRAMQSLCQNNLLGIVVNGARRGELYSKFTYYHSYYYTKTE